MNRHDLKSLLMAAARPKVRNNFNFEDLQSAAKNAIIEHFNLKDASIRELKYKPEVFALIDEVLDEAVPLSVEDRIGQFADVKVYNRDDDVYFNIKTTNTSKRRMYKTIKRGARGGIYQARRLDGSRLHLDTKVESVGYQITLEDLLTGARTINELVDILADAWTERIYVEVMESLFAAKQLAPAPNHDTGTGGAIDHKSLDSIIRIVSAYGNPTIFGFRQELALINNGSVPALGSNTPNIPTSDLDEIKAKGYVGMYKGVPLVELPNYLLDTTNTKWLFENTDLLILPSGEKPVKVAFKGEGYTKEVQQPHGGLEFHNHRIMGTGILFYNNIGVYTVTY